MGRKKVNIANVNTNGDMESIDNESESETELEIVSSDPKDIRARIFKEITKELGNNIIVKGSEIIERPRTIIPVSPRINQALNGGIPEGSWVILAGEPKAGKTLTALHFAKKCQEERYGGRNVYYLNIEGRLKKRDILGIPGIDAERLTIIESTEDKILSSQDFLTIAEKILHTDKRCLVIFDSVSQLCEEKALINGIGTETRGGGAKLMSQFTAQMANVVPVKNSIVICILHVLANTSGWGSNTFEKGGNSIQFQVDVKLRVQGAPVLRKVSDKSPPFGQIVTWKCLSSALGPPHRVCESYIRYGEGVDEIHEAILDAKDIGLITGSSHLTFNFLKSHIKELGINEWNDDTIKEIGAKPNGADKARDVLANNPQWLEWLKTDLENMLKV